MKRYLDVDTVICQNWMPSFHLVQKLTVAAIWAADSLCQCIALVLSPVQEDFLCVPR